MKKTNLIPRLYRLAVEKSLSPQNNIVYEVQPLESEVCRIRVDCGSIGSFYVSYSENEELYSESKDRWEVRKIKNWAFESLDELFDGFPVITPEQGFKFLKTFDPGKKSLKDGKILQNSTS